MSTHFDPPRILVITPEISCIPCGMDAKSKHVSRHSWQLTGRLRAMISRLYRLGADVLVAQPDFRQIFKLYSQNVQITTGQKFPTDKVFLAEDRVFFYSKRLDLNGQWENIKLSIAFQREVINTIIPYVQPDLIHCHDWMTGLLPAFARKLEIPCLFSVYKFDSIKSSLSCIEDMGIDAASFWQNLYYSRYPFTYEETREGNPSDFLLSGIFAAHFVSITGLNPFWPEVKDCEGPSEGPTQKLLAEKQDCQCLAFTHGGGARQYIDLYERMLNRPIASTGNEAGENQLCT